MTLSRGRFKQLFLTAAILLVFIAAAVPAGAYAPEGAPEPSLLVMQVIDNQFYMWHEYINKTDGSLSVYLLEPYKKALNAAETAELFEASRLWEKQSLESINITTDTDFNSEPMIDNRTPVDGSLATKYPYNNIGYLDVRFSGSNIRGTAFLISPHVALTNGHNVYTNDLGGWFSRIYFSPGQYETAWPDTVQPYSTKSPLKVETNSLYLKYEDEGNRDMSVIYDYAALLFEQPFAGIDTFIPLQFNYIPEQVSIPGYPGLVRNKKTLGMWDSKGSLLGSDQYFLYYNAFTSPGNSGSPVVVYNQQAGTYRVIALHTFASYEESFSGGIHFNGNNRQMIEKWLRWAPETTPQPDIVLLKGDINADELINVIDAVLVSQFVLGLIDLDQEARDRADVNEDGLVNVLDAAMIMQYALGLIYAF